MSADYDRLFHSPDAVRTADEEPGRDSAVPQGSAPSGDATPPPMPAAAPRTQTAQAPPSWQTEVMSPVSDVQPPPQAAPQQRVPNNGMMRAPQSAPSAGARHEQRPMPAPAPRPAPAPPPSQFYGENTDPRHAARRRRPPRWGITGLSMRCPMSGSGPRSRCRPNGVGGTGFT
ncbi:hypothetical protein H7I76_31260 [Mycolicibacterium vaccae]|nr:hypothetical protein [Mycolicibacterium vaccae]